MRKAIQKSLPLTSKPGIPIAASRGTNISPLCLLLVTLNLKLILGNSFSITSTSDSATQDNIKIIEQLQRER